MVKKIVLLTLGLGIAIQAQAFDRNQINYNDFWGTWSIYNSKMGCSEVFSFSKPSSFTYGSKQKKASGRFSILSNSDSKLNDVLILNIKTDNKQLGCNGQSIDFTNKKINYVLKWVSPKTAEICTDREAKNCTGAYLIKQ